MVEVTKLDGHMSQYAVMIDSVSKRYSLCGARVGCMIPFDWGLQYDPRGYLFISEMVSGVYVVQFDEDKDPRFNYPPLWTPIEE